MDTRARADWPRWNAKSTLDPTRLPIWGWSLNVVDIWVWRRFSALRNHTPPCIIQWFWECSANLSSLKSAIHHKSKSPSDRKPWYNRQREKTHLRLIRSIHCESGITLEARNSFLLALPLATREEETTATFSPFPTRDSYLQLKEDIACLAGYLSWIRSEPLFTYSPTSQGSFLPHVHLFMWRVIKHHWCL